MRITYRRCLLTKETVKEFANDNDGIYILSNSDEVIYIGKSDDVEKCLGYISCPDERNITVRFLLNTIIDFDPDNFVNELLQLHKEAYGKLPKFNETSEISLESADINI